MPRLSWTMVCRVFPLAALVALFSAGAPARAAVRLWNADPMLDVRTEADLGPVQPIEPIRLVGPRNGYCSGQVVAAGDGLNGLRATVTDMTSAEGGSIPAADCTVRYAGIKKLQRTVKTQNPNSDPLGIGELFSNSPYYDGLYDEPPAGAALLPVWLTVHVHADARPGRYGGTLTVGGTPVPVQLEVGPWRCPDPADWTVHTGLLQSPESVAMQYGVPEWSDRHLKLMAASYRLLGELGNQDLFITAIPRNHMGQEHPIVRFTANGDGTYTPDFRVLDKYLDLYARYVRAPHAIIAYLWDPGLAGIPRLRQRQNRFRGQKICVVDAQGGLSTVEVPLPGEEGSEGIWRPVMDGILQRVEAHGWSRDAIVMGCANDRRPGAKEAAFFKKIAPYARWSVWTHGNGDPEPTDGRLVLRDIEVGHYEHPYCPDPVFPREDGIMGGWNMEFPEFVNPRKYIFPYSPLTQYRNFAEGTTLTGGVRYRRRAHGAGGFSRIGLDYWDVDDGRALLLKWDAGGWGNMYRQSPRAITEPGPDGAVGTVRLEMLREGIQECEARIAIERALLAHAVPAPLAEQCTALLKERIAARYKDGKFTASHGARISSPQARVWGMAPNWQDLTERLFDLAGRVETAQAPAAQ